MLPFCFGVCLYLKEIVRIPLFWGPLTIRQLSVLFFLPSSQTQALIEKYINVKGVVPHGINIGLVLIKSLGSVRFF